MSETCSGSSSVSTLYESLGIPNDTPEAESVVCPCVYIREEKKYIYVKKITLYIIIYIIKITL